MKKYNIVYWQNGNKLKLTIEAESKQQAIYLFTMNVSHFGIESVEEVQENV